MTQLAGRHKRKERQLCLRCCARLTIRRLTFHTKFGAPSVFVDKNEKDEEEDASKACQAHSNRNLGEERRRVRTRLASSQPAWLPGLTHTSRAGLPQRPFSPGDTSPRQQTPESLASAERSGRASCFYQTKARGHAWPHKLGNHTVFSPKAD